jgi:hypothetical protein
MTTAVFSNPPTSLPNPREETAYSVGDGDNRGNADECKRQFLGFQQFVNPRERLVDVNLNDS